MRFRIRKKKAASAPPAEADASSTPALPETADGAGGAMIVASPDRHGTENGGSKDESFFEARPWLDSDSEDDFQSVRGDFTPSRGSTPDHQMQTSFAARTSVDRPIPSLTEKKQRLLELLQEKQQYDDEQDVTTDAGSETGNSIHAEEHLNPSGKVEKAKKPAKTGCFACSAWKLSFKSCWKKKKEQKDL